MKSSIVYLLAAIATSTSATPLLDPRQSDTYPCVSGVFILAARGTDTANKTPPNSVNANYTQLQGQEDIANALIAKAGQGSYLRALPYAAAPSNGLGLTPYRQSRQVGAAKAQNITINYINSCLKQNIRPRVVLLGYSQGADVMINAIIGGNGLNSLEQYKQYIVGAAPIASLYFRRYDSKGKYFLIDQDSTGPFDGSTSGDYTVQQYESFNTTWSDRVKAYCQTGDRFCAGNLLGDTTGIHEDAVNHFKGAATQFLLPKV